MKVVYALFFLVGCTGCFNQQKGESFKELLSRFPQLPRQTTKSGNNYKFIRSISNDRNVTIQLREASDSDNRIHQVITIINAQGQTAHVPLLPNPFRDYWQFQHLPNLLRSNYTFEKELKNSIEGLGLNDTTGTTGMVLEEIFLSLLRCRSIHDSDSTDLNGMLRSVYRNEDEPEDSCSIMQRKNWMHIHKVIHPSEHSFRDFTTFLDSRNNRIYQFIGIPKRHKKLVYSIKVYQPYCEIKPLIL
ncbi:hypothetical protein [Solirubrum puertoriconensis]|uniref:hypothetical protein n=1 Tax=Solirubrum puertoriconensis TaxID=1751427 RepID=UPI00122E8F60|nr:hypothetical protein [Solirubrum puertoriconensis]